MLNHTTMAENDVLVHKQRLMSSLGGNYENYLLIMRKWFDMEIESKSHLEKELSQILSPDQFRLHKVLLASIIEKSSNLEGSVRLQRHFQPIDSFTYAVVERHKVQETPPPPLMGHTRSVITKEIAVRRFIYGAKEMHLNCIEEQVAKLLTIATRHLLKNLITGMVCRRKNFKVKPNGFVHDVGSRVINPWNKNVFNRRKSLFHPLMIDERSKGLIVPNPRPSREELERERVFGETVSDSPSTRLLPLSLTDLIVALKVNPNLIPSSYVKTINMERMFAKMGAND